jgi:arsenate reductase (thioredoxin)
MERQGSVLFLCTGNSCRSQMAAGLLRELAGDRFDVYSAGTDPAERVHPLAIEVMAERGIDISGSEPTDVKQYLGRLPVRHLIIVCQGANESCPTTFPGALNRLFWPLDDPAKFMGSEDDTLHKFREVRDQIEDKLTAWLKENC